jgi:hypothetical protein
MYYLTPELDGDECSASRPGRFISGKEPLVPIGLEAGWVGPSSGFYAVVKRKILSPCRDSNLRSSRYTTELSRLILI